MRQLQRYASLMGTLSLLLGHFTTQPSVAQSPPKVLQKNHSLAYGTFLGGIGDDQARSVAVLDDGNLIVAGNFATVQASGAKVSNLPGVAATARGKLLKLSADGRRILAILTVGNRIDDMELQSVPGQPYQERLVVGGDFGVTVIGPATMIPFWSKTVPGASGNGSADGGQTRVSIARNNQVVALRAKTVTLFNRDGNQKAQLKIDRDYVTDVAIDPSNKSVYVVGYANRFNANNLGKTGKPNPVQIAFLYALNTTNLSPIWSSWDYNPNLLTPSTEVGSAPQNNMADTRLYQVIVGGDGKLAVKGEAAGGNNIFRWNGKDFKTQTIVKYDAYSDTYNSKSPHLLYYAKVEPSTGMVIAGQHAVPRLPGAKPGQVGLANTFRANDGGFAVDSQGNMHIGGVSSFGIPERDENTFSGIPVAPYKPYDMTLLSVSSDFRKRIRWTPLGREATPGDAGGGGTLSAISLNNKGQLVMLGTADFGNLMTTANGLAPTPFDPAADKSRDVYLGILNIAP